MLKRIFTIFAFLMLMGMPSRLFAQRDDSYVYWDNVLIACIDCDVDDAEELKQMLSPLVSGKIRLQFCIKEFLPNNIGKDITLIGWELSRGETKISVADSSEHLKIRKDSRMVFRIADIYIDRKYYKNKALDHQRKKELVNRIYKRLKPYIVDGKLKPIKRTELKRILED